MKNILIIGGTRFIGPALIDNLLGEDVRITVFNRGTKYNAFLPSCVKHIKGDRRDTKTMKILAKEKYDLVYDLCCFNQTDAVNLLENIQPTSHLVFLSTAAVYKKPLIYPLTEESVLGEWDSFGDYGTQKVDAEKKFESYAKKYGLKLTIFRPVYLLGKGNYFDRENYYFSRIINKDSILIPGKGNAVIQFAFLEETASAFKLVPQKQTEQIEILNIAGDDYISVKDFIVLCADIVNKTPNFIELDTKRFELDEEHFYDDFYPFPNLTFIASNKKITQKYGIKFKPLYAGLHDIYLDWKKRWNGKTNIYSHEQEIFKKISKYG